MQVPCCVGTKSTDMDAAVLTGTLRWRSTAILNANSFSDVPTSGRREGAHDCYHYPMCLAGRVVAARSMARQGQASRGTGDGGVAETRVLIPTEWSQGKGKKVDRQFGRMLGQSCSGARNKRLLPSLSSNRSGRDGCTRNIKGVLPRSDESIYSPFFNHGIAPQSFLQTKPPRQGLSIVFSSSSFFPLSHFRHPVLQHRRFQNSSSQALHSTVTPAYCSH